jgi:hypothetical protein
VPFYFQPADLVQVLNFGAPTQIDVQIQGRDREKRKMAAVPGIVDAHIQQELDAPEMYYMVPHAERDGKGSSSRK